MTPNFNWLLGSIVKQVTYLDESRQWVFEITGNAVLSVFCPWQIIADGRVSLANGDNGQQYGLPAPIDAVDRATTLLSGRKINRFTADEISADLTIVFDEGVCLRTFNDSSGYEAWQLTGAKGIEFVAQGGGNIVSYP